jgi:hypothetical protein
MRQLLNQNSFVLVAFVLLGSLLLFSRRRLRRVRFVAIPVLVVVLVAAALVLRTGSSDVRSGTELDRVLARGKPVALEFYSNF